jgi:hypothetical protein
MNPPWKEAGINAAPDHRPARFALPMIGVKIGQAHLKPARFLSNEWGEAQSCFPREGKRSPAKVSVMARAVMNL